MKERLKEVLAANKLKDKKNQLKNARPYRWVGSVRLVAIGRQIIKIKGESHVYH
jgi:hypothetical protein